MWSIRARRYRVELLGRKDARAGERKHARVTPLNDYWPPFHPWTPDDWRRFFEAGHDVCFVCDKPVDDPKYACALELHRSWDPVGASGYLFAHIECLRKLHPTLG